jgi:hypothetical protein
MTMQTRVIAVVVFKRAMLDAEVGRVGVGVRIEGGGWGDED